METGWRRARNALGLAVCTSIPRNPEPVDKQQSPSPSPRTCANLGLLSNPTTPRLQQQQQLQSQPVSSPRLRCKTTINSKSSPRVHSRSKSQSRSQTTSASARPLKVSTNSNNDSPRLQCKTNRSPRIIDGSKPSSPKSPSRFALLKNHIRLSRSSCGVCLQSMKTGQGTAIFTAECSHAFHFHCISAQVKKHGSLVCPVCRANWRDISLLPMHRGQDQNHHNQQVPEIHEKAHQEQSISEPRLYDDDEPLMKPNGARFFNTIPEAQEEVEEDIEEFKGFCITPSCSGPEEIRTSSSGGPRTNLQLKLLPEPAVVSTGRTHETFAVLFQIKAPLVRGGTASNTAASLPLLDPACRAPIDLVTVLDVSGSMSGAKLSMLKRAMRLVISSLGASDRLSIVAFSLSSKRLLPLRRMTTHGQRAARRVVDRLGCGQGTCVGEALKKAAKVLEDRREQNPVASIILLSNGQDERDRSTSDAPVSTLRRRPSSSSTRFGHLEIPVHAFGFGNDHHEPAEDAFAKCVGGLLSVVVQDLRLQIRCAGVDGGEVELAAVYSCANRPSILYSAESRNGFGTVTLGNLYAEEEREILIEFRQPLAQKATTGSSAPHHLISFTACYKDPVTQEPVYYEEQSLVLQRPHPLRSATPEVERLQNRFLTTRAVAQSRHLVELGELTVAHHMLASVRAALLQSRSNSADEHLRILESEIAGLHRRRQQQQQQHLRRRAEQDWVSTTIDENGEELTPTSAWRAAERLAKVAIMRKSLNRVSDLHGFENARF